MMRGNILFYQSTGKWYERLITLATHGPYVHVALVVNEYLVLAADTQGTDTQGIAYDAVPPIDGLHAAVSLAEYATPDSIERGLVWAEKQRGRRYGWADIIYQAVKFLAPNNPLRFGEAGHYDCSDFVTRYLIHAGVQVPDSYLDTYTVTPNDLARFFEMIPTRKKPE